MKKNKLMIFPFFRYLHQHWTFFLIIFVGFIGELLLVSVFLRVLPDSWYLRAYLPWTAILKTERFVQGKMDVQRDAERGWRNQDNEFSEVSEINFIRKRMNSKPEIRRRHRILILGDSRMNYSNVESQETISAYLEDQNIETINWGTAMYGLDQIILALEEGLKRLQPEIVVIALGTETGELLDSHYLPFLYPTIGLPLLKPKFVLEQDSLKKMSVTRFIENNTSLFNSDLLEYLKAYDPHYSRFEWFKKRRFTPLLCLSSLVRERVIEGIHQFSIKRNHETRIANPKIVEALILHSQKLAEKNNTKLLYLLLPQKADLMHHRDQNYLQLTRFLAVNNIQYINAFKLFQENTGKVEVFDRDGVHFTASANYFLAQALFEIVTRPGSLVAR